MASPAFCLLLAMSRHASFWLTSFIMYLFRGASGRLLQFPVGDDEPERKPDGVAPATDPMG